MSKKCAIVPQVRNPKTNKVEDSRLFKDLLSFTNNHKEAGNAYLITKNPRFNEKWGKSLDTDIYGEPTMASLISETNLKDIIGDNKVLEKLNKDFGHTDKKGKVKLKENTTENYKELVDKAIDFNNNSEFKKDYVATIEKTYDNESGELMLSSSIAKKNKVNSREAIDMETNRNLNNKLENILASKGVAVGALTKLEERRGVAGVTDFSKAKDAAKGLVELIRLAKGEKGAKALPEEFAHFAIEALGDNPLINRLINHLDSNNLVSDILGKEFETYETLYEGNPETLAREAAGKLLAKHLFQNEAIPSSPVRNFLSRVMNSIKNFFSSFNETSVQRAMREADVEMGDIAKNILNGSLLEDIQLSNINTSQEYYSTKERIERDRKILSKLRDNELKRLKIYEQRNPNSKFNDNQRLLIDRLEAELASNNEIEGIYIFLSNALEELNKVNTRLELIRGQSTDALNEKAKVLRDVRNYIYSYSNVLDFVRDALLDESREVDNRYGDRIKVSLDQVELLIKNLQSDYNKVTMPLFLEFIKPYLGESIEVPFGKNKGKIMKAEDLLKKAEKDIGFFDRWLDSMADSSDFMLKSIDQVVKNSKEESRLKTIALSKRLQAAGIKLEQEGVNDTEWMFEKDADGNKTGNYISEINHSLFKTEMSKMFRALNAKYGRNPVGEDALNYEREKKQWFNENMETINGNRRPLFSKYKSVEYEALLRPENKAKLDFFNEIMDIKESLDDLLPDKYTKLNSAVKIRKDLLERVKASKGLKSAKQEIWESIKDEFLVRSDDNDFATKATVIDFEKREVQILPIYYTKLKKGESANDLSTDIVETMTAYAAMAYDFHEMNKVIDVLEIGRDLMRERTVQQTVGDKPIVEKFKILGRTVENKLTKRGDETRFMGRLDDYFSMQVYGKYMKDEGTVGNTNISYAKLANFVNRLTAMNNLALNGLSGVANIATGKVMMRIEAIAGEFFNERDVLKADAIYGKSLGHFLAEMGNRVKTNKLSLFSEMFNTMQEFEKDLREINFNRKTWFSRMANTSALFFMNNCGEHWMQNRTALALAVNYKMKDNHGKDTNLWEALEVKYIDANNKALGAELTIKDGYTKADGTAFTKEDIKRFTKKSAAINQRMHGIYNKLDRNAFQQLAVGRMAMMFRKWMKPSMNRRFKKATYNYDLEAWTEGYYLSLGNFLMEVGKDLRNTQFTLMAHWKDLHPTEKKNIKRAVTELTHFFAIAIALGMIEWDDDSPWLTKMFEYQLRRLYTELGAMTPTTALPQEGLRLLQSPAAGINTIEKLMGLMSLFNYNNYETFGGEEALIKTGTYKGKSKAQRAILRSPLAPMYNTVNRVIDVEHQIPFYKQ